MRSSSKVRALAWLCLVMMVSLFAAGCSKKVEQEAPTGSAPPSGNKGAVQPGTIQKAPATD